jgi:hypothetical protein
VGITPPPHRRARRHPTLEPELGFGLLVEVVQPIADRRERRRAGQHRTHRDGQQTAQRVAHPTRIARVGNSGQRVQQPTVLTIDDRRGLSVRGECRYDQRRNEG